MQVVAESLADCDVIKIHLHANMQGSVLLTTQIISGESIPQMLHPDHVPTDAQHKIFVCSSDSQYTIDAWDRLAVKCCAIVVSVILFGPCSSIQFQSSAIHPHLVLYHRETRDAAQKLARKLSQTKAVRGVSLKWKSGNTFASGLTFIDKCVWVRLRKQRTLIVKMGEFRKEICCTPCRRFARFKRVDPATFFLS